MLTVLQYLSIAYILGFAALLILSLLRPIQLSRAWYALGLGLALALSVWGYALIPGSRLDLYRHYEYIDRIRGASMSLPEMLLDREGRYAGLWGFQLLCFLTAQLPKNNWLSCFSVLITVSILICLLIHYLRSEGYRSGALVLGLLAVFAGLQLQYVFSGVRNGLAAAFSLLGLYLICFRKKHYLPAAFLLILSATTHPAPLILLPVLLLSRQKGQPLWRLCALASVPLIFSLASWLAGTASGYLRLLSQRILFYADAAYAYDRPEMIANLTAFVTTALVYRFHRRQGLPEGSGFARRYRNFYYLLGFVMIGCAVHRDFALRIGYMMGALSVPMLCGLYCRPGNQPPGIWMRLVRAGHLLTLLVCGAKVYFDTFTVIRQWQFLF